MKTVQVTTQNRFRRISDIFSASLSGPPYAEPSPVFKNSPQRVLAKEFGMPRPAKAVLAKGVIVESVGDNVLVMVPERGLVNFTGATATLIRSIHAGHPINAQQATVSELIDLGVIQSPEGVTRRGVIKAGAIGAGAGIAFVALPSVAAATSGCPLVEAVPDSTDNNYGGSEIYFEVSVPGANVASGVTNFRWEAQFLPVGTYYITVSAPASGTVEAFTYQETFTVSPAGVYIRTDFSRAGVFAGGPGSESAYEALLTYSLYSDANRSCPIVFTPDYALAAGL